MTKRYIIEETKFDDYDRLLLTAVRMRNDVNELAWKDKDPDGYAAIDTMVMDYMVINAACAPRESDVLRVVAAMARCSEDDVRVSINRLARPGKNKFLRVGRRSHSYRGRSERLIELNYYHAED